MHIWCLLGMWCFTVFIYFNILFGTGKMCYVFTRLQVVLVWEDLTLCIVLSLYAFGVIKLVIQNLDLFVVLQGAECGINAEVDKQLEMGKKLLAAGQLADALSHFHAAIGMYLMKVTLALKYLWVWVFLSYYLLH